MKEEQLEILGHSLGIHPYHAKRSKLKRDKKLPKEFYRNRFYGNEAHSDWPIINDLIKLGYMAKGWTINEGRDTLWYVTDLGIERFRQAFFEYVQIKS